jgi:hypothetical protein
MAATKTRKPLEKEEEKKPVVLPTILTEQGVLAYLGKPTDLHSVEVHRYDTMRCRVNVRRELTKTAAETYFKSRRSADYKKIVDGIDCTMNKTIVLITDSFYLKTNYDGSLRSDNLPIERKY